MLKTKKIKFKRDKNTNLYKLHSLYIKLKFYV